MTPNWEQDFAPNGARRYVLKEHPKEHQVKQRVRYAEGHAPIPRPIFEGARDRIMRRGSPETVGVSYQRLDSILSTSCRLRL